jgi:peptide/nickel transport system substrate-binding protein
MNARMTRREFLRVAGIAAGVAALSAWAPAPASIPLTAMPRQAAPTAVPTAGAPKRGGTLVMGAQNDTSTLDPHRSSGPSSVQSLVYDSLIRWDVDAKGNCGPAPALATTWTFEGSTVVMKLRQGVKFHDGSDFNAEVAKFNLERMNDSKSVARAFVSAIKTIDIVDPYTIKLNLTGPSGSLLSNLSQAADSRPWIISKAMAEKAGDKYGTSPETTAGSGPMKLVEFVVGSHHVLQRTGQYWEKGEDGQPLPYYDTMRWRFIKDDSVRATELRTGNIQWQDILATKDIAPLQKDPNFVLAENPFQMTCYQFTFSAKSEKFADANIRKAAHYAIDREAMAKVLGQGFGAPHYWFLTPGYLGYDEKLPHYSFDPAKAKQLLADAGFKNGIDASLLIINREGDQQEAQILKQMLGDVGIRLNIEALERVAWLDKVATMKYDMAIYQTGVRPDPDSILAGRFQTGEQKNQAGMSDPVIDDWLAKGRASFDDTVRAAAYAEVQKRIYETAQYGTIWMSSIYGAFSKKVKNWKMLQSGADIRYAWLES